jgi:hypothetical protein
MAIKHGGGEEKEWKMESTDLNQVCPKDPFKLPKIDLFVDATT